MHLPKMSIALGLAISSLIFSPAFAQEAAPQQNAQEVELSPTDQIRVNVLVAEDILQKTLDELQKNPEKFGDDWDDIENGFVLFSIAESANVNTLFYDQDFLCHPLGGDKCTELVTNDLLMATQGMITRAETIQKAAMNEPLSGLDKKIESDPVAPLQKALGESLTAETRAALAEDGRVYMKMKVAYLGLLGSLAKFYKNEQLEALIESESARLDEERANLLNSLYGLTGREPVQPTPIGPTRRAALIEEFTK